jgi:hypothetical protein
VAEPVANARNAQLQANAGAVLHGLGVAS